MWVQSLGGEDPLEKEIKTHSIIFAWRIPWTEEPGGQQPLGLQRGGHDSMTCTHTGCTYTEERSWEDTLIFQLLASRTVRSEFMF